MSSGGHFFDDDLRVRIEGHLELFERVASADPALRAAAVAIALLADPEGRACFVITRRADAIIDNLFPVFGREDVSFGTPIRWHYDAFNDRACPMRFWSTIDYLNFKEAGDHKVIWELNRHQYLLRLGEAYLARHGHGGRRKINPESTHHSISLKRIEQWRDRWDILGLDLEII